MNKSARFISQSQIIAFISIFLSFSSTCIASEAKDMLPKSKSVSDAGWRLASDLEAFKPHHSPKAIQRIVSLADRGDARAQMVLGLAYQNGDGVGRDFATALRWYRQSATLGYPQAQITLGSIYAVGDGVPQDFAIAASWYQKAADQGDVVAQNLMADLYQSGRGVPQDYVLAASWYQRAADQGDVLAQFTLGLYYDTGVGVTKDPVQSYKWYFLAAEAAQDGKFRQSTVGMRDFLASQMTSAQIAEAQRLARSWKQK